MKKLVLLPLALSLMACAPVVSKPAEPPPATVAPVSITINYQPVSIKAGEDNPLLAAIVALAPTAPRDADRQPWRATTIEKNRVVIQAFTTKVDVSSLEATRRSMPQEITFNAITANNMILLTANYSSLVAPTADFIVKQLNQQFKRVP